MKRRIAAILAVLTVLVFSVSAAAEGGNVSQMAKVPPSRNLLIDETNGVATAFNGDIAVFPDFFGIDPDTGDLCYYVRVENETSKQMTIAVEGQGEMFVGENPTGEITLKGGEEGYVRFAMVDNYNARKYSEYPPTGKFWAKDANGGDDARSSFSSTKFGARPAETMEIGIGINNKFLPEQHWTCDKNNDAFDYDEESGILVAKSDGSITFVGTSENNELLFRVVSTVNSLDMDKYYIDDTEGDESYGGEDGEQDTDLTPPKPIKEMEWLSAATPEAFENIEPTVFEPDKTSYIDLGPLDFITDYIDIPSILSSINVDSIGSFLMYHEKETIAVIIILVLLRAIRKSIKSMKKIDN